MSDCMYKNRLGKRGELIAKNFLLKKGLTFVKENYRYDRAEIDLVFEDKTNKLLLFVEVKTRTNKRFGEPEEAVTPLKMDQIRKAAMGFTTEHEMYNTHDLRLDVVSIILTGENTEINHIENAF